MTQLADPSLGPMIGEQWADWHKRHLAAEAAAQAAGEQETQALAQEQAAAGRRQAGIERACRRITGRMKRQFAVEGLVFIAGVMLTIAGPEMNYPNAQSIEPGAPELAVGVPLMVRR